MTSGYVMRAPCSLCGGTVGELRPTNGQNCVFCSRCGVLSYNAPKTETGEPTRSISTRPDIKPAQRSRILMRDGSRCTVCGASPPALLHVGHIISVADGKRGGLSDAELFDDANLAVMCEECNLGLGENSLALRLAVVCLRSNILRATSVLSTDLCACGHARAAHRAGSLCVRCNCKEWRAP